MPLVLSNLLIGPYQVLLRRARVDLRAMAMKGCSVFPKAPALLGPHYQTVYCHIRTLVGGAYPSTEVHSVYSTALGILREKAFNNYKEEENMQNDRHHQNCLKLKT